MLTTKSIDRSCREDPVELNSSDNKGGSLCGDRKNYKESLDCIYKWDTGALQSVIEMISDNLIQYVPHLLKENTQQPTVSWQSPIIPIYHPYPFSAKVLVMML